MNFLITKCKFYVNVKLIFGENPLTLSKNLFRLIYN